MHRNTVLAVLATTLAAGPAFALDLGGVVNATGTHSVTTQLGPVLNLVGNATGTLQTTSSLPLPGVGSLAPLGALTGGSLLGNLSGVTQVVEGAAGSGILGGGLPVGGLPAIGNVSGVLSTVSSLTSSGGLSLPHIDLPVAGALPIPSLPSLPISVNLTNTVDAALSGISLPNLPSVALPAVGLPSLGAGGAIGSVTNLVGNIGSVGSLDPTAIVPAVSILGSLTGNGAVGMLAPTVSSIPAMLPSVAAAIPSATISHSMGAAVDLPSLPSFGGTLPQLAAPISKVDITSSMNAAINGIPSAPSL